MTVPAKITAVHAREVLDSRGNPTVQAEVWAGQFVGIASVPSGASTGSFEALELRDKDPKRFHGKGVLNAVSNVNRLIAPSLVGLDCGDRKTIDERMIAMDGTVNKSKLGANSILAVSMAVARVAARSSGKSLFRELAGENALRLPVPMMNVINGGEHADNGLAVQEFMIEPVGADTCADAVRIGSEVYHSLKKVLSAKYGGGATNVGDEGGFAPPMETSKEALGSLQRAIADAGYSEASVRLGLDAAASTFKDPKTGKYELDGKTLDDAGLEDYYASLCQEFGLLSIEDPFGEEDYAAFASLTKRLGRKTVIVGDDIYVTNISRIKKGVAAGASNGILIKLNQIGTVTETEAAIRMGKEAKWAIAVSHRSGETEDSFISHLATAFGAEFIKAGAPARGERVVKYNELMRIVEELGDKATYAGKAFA